MNAHVHGTETPTPSAVTQIEIAWMQSSSGIPSESEATAVAAGRGLTLTSAQDCANFMNATCRGTDPAQAYYSLSSANLVNGQQYVPSVRITDNSYGVGTWHRGNAFIPSTSTTTTTTTPAETTTTTTTAAPTTTTTAAPAIFTDNFDRADGNVGSNYTTINSLTLPVISSNKVTGSSTNDSWALCTASLPNNQYAQIDSIAFVSGTTNRVAGVIVRGRSAGPLHCYVAQIFNDGSGSYYVWLYKYVEGSATQLHSTTVSSSTYTGVRLEASGTTLTIKGYNGTTWVTVATVTDSSIASGSAGLRMFCAGGTITADNFACGSV